MLLITIDTLRADYVGAYGGPVPTPHMDALAEEGVKFDVALAHVPLTLPSHASILTGLDPLSHGVHNNGTFALKSRYTTIAESFEDAGYRTGAFVGAYPVDSRFGLSQGFEVYDDRIPKPRWESFVVSDRPGGQVVDSAMDWLGQRGDDELWFAWVHLYDPHFPYRPPDPWFEDHADDRYGGEVAYTDAMLGRLFDFLRERGEFEDLLIAFTSDHGEGLGDHREKTHGTFAYHSTIWVPFFLRFPGRIPAGASIGPRVRHIDLMPTVLDYAGVAGPEEMDGESLRPLIENDGDWQPKIMYFESMAMTFNYNWASPRGVYVGDSKYIDLPIPELYDIESDFDESENLWKSWPEEAVNVRLRYERFLNRRLPGGAIEVNPVPVEQETLDKLRALGYAGGVQSTKISAEQEFTPEDDPKNLVQFVNMLDEAGSLFTQGKPQESIRLFRQLLDQRKDLPLAYVNLGGVYFKTDQLQKAIDTLEEGYRRGITNDLLLVRLGHYLKEAGKLDRAEAILEQAVQLYPTQIDANNFLGMTYYEKGEPEKALEIFENLLSQDPSLVSAHNNAGTVYLGTNRPDRAIEHFREAIELNPNAAEAFNGLGVAMAQKGRQGEAIRLWKRAVELDPELYDTLYNLGVLLTQQNRFAEAAEYLEQFVATAPERKYREDITEVERLLQRIKAGP